MYTSLSYIGLDLLRRILNEDFKRVYTSVPFQPNGEYGLKKNGSRMTAKTLPFYTWLWDDAYMNTSEGEKNDSSCWTAIPDNR